MYPIDKVVQDIWNKLRAFDVEAGTNYSKEFTGEKIKEILRNSLKKVGWDDESLTEENYRKALQVFGIIKRKRAKTLRFEIEAKNLKKLSTKDLKKTSLGIGSFRRGVSVFFDEDFLNKSLEDDIAVLKELIEDETLPRMAIKEVRNKFNFKTSLNVVFTHSKPERKFVEKLIDNSDLIDAWIKSRDTSFYSIDYSWRKGEHPK